MALLYTILLATIKKLLLWKMKKVLSHFSMWVSMAKWIRLSSLNLTSVGSIPVMSNLFLFDFLGNLLFEVSKHLSLATKALLKIAAHFIKNFNSIFQISKVLYISSISTLLHYQNKLKALQTNWKIDNNSFLYSTVMFKWIYKKSKKKIWLNLKKEMEPFFLYSIVVCK